MTTATPWLQNSQSRAGRRGDHEAKRRALDEIATRQRTADEKREREIERQRHAEIATLSLTIQ
jgi:hypothetical protein